MSYRNSGIFSLGWRSKLSRHLFWWTAYPLVIFSQYSRVWILYNAPIRKLREFQPAPLRIARPTATDVQPTHSSQPATTDPQRPTYSDQLTATNSKRPTKSNQPTATDPQQPTHSEQLATKSQQSAHGNRNAKINAPQLTHRDQSTTTDLWLTHSNRPVATDPQQQIQSDGGLGPNQNTHLRLQPLDTLASEPYRSVESIKQVEEWVRKGSRAAAAPTYTCPRAELLCAINRTGESMRSGTALRDWQSWWIS